MVDLAGTYALLSSGTQSRLGIETHALDAQALREAFPWLDADIAQLEPGGGVADLPAVSGALTRALEDRGVRTVEGAEPRAIDGDGEAIRVITAGGELVTRSLVIAAGHGTNGVLSLLPGCRLQVPIARDRPREAKYLVPPAGARHRFTADAMPVVAYLDAGIYCHPIVDGLVDAV